MPNESYHYPIEKFYENRDGAALKNLAEEPVTADDLNRQIMKHVVKSPPIKDPVLRMSLEDSTNRQNWINSKVKEMMVDFSGDLIPALVKHQKILFGKDAVFRPTTFPHLSTEEHNALREIYPNRVLPPMPIEEIMQSKPVQDALQRQRERASAS